MSEPILLSWSGGKDSALALHALRQTPDVEVAGLLTTVTEDYDRISMHEGRMTAALTRIGLIRANPDPETGSFG